MSPTLEGDLIDFSTDDVVVLMPVEQSMSLMDEESASDLADLAQLSLEPPLSRFERLPAPLKCRIYEFLIRSESTDLTIRATREDIGYPIHCYKRITYSSIIAMFRVNKAIGEESRAYFFREHPFMVVAAADETASHGKMKAVCYKPKVPFSRHVLRFTLSSDVEQNFRHQLSQEKLMINASYLPDFIRSLLIVMPMCMEDASAFLELRPALPPSAPEIRTVKLNVLDPFKHLVRLRNVRLSSNFDSVYREELVTAMTSMPPLWPYFRDESRNSRVRAKHYASANNMVAAAREYEESHRLCIMADSQDLTIENEVDEITQRALAIGRYISVTIPAGSVYLAETMSSKVFRDIDRHGAAISPQLKPKLYFELGMMHLRQAIARSVEERMAGIEIDDLEKAESPLVKALADSPHDELAKAILSEAQERVTDCLVILSAHRDLDG
ncbi:hypothetical protein MMC18_009533 [Xylographa bjoerkii]|nr:hypothetical protein [Xylographa bjoerkii]